MFPKVSRNKQRLICLVGTMVLGGVCLPALAEATSNPYEVIVERNPFGLKPPPPPAPPPTNEGQATPPAQVEVTGITSILSSKRVLLEIIPGPGKPMLKPILAEGERVESVEVVSINVEKNEVTIKNGPITTNLTFKVAKASPAPAPTAGLNPAAGHPIVVQPTIQTPFSQNPAAAGRNNVIVAGGSPSAPPAVPAVPVPTSPFGTPNPVAPTSPP